MNEFLTYRDAVIEIKKAILQSRYRAANKANIEQLTLNYNIGSYISDNTRSGKWGTGALESISKQLQSELPGIRGYSATNIKYMRIFFEQWVSTFEPNRQLPTDDLGEENLDLQNRQLATGDLAKEDVEAFFRIGFTHHTEILSKCGEVDERWYYIKRCASEFWNVLVLKSHLISNDYEKKELYQITFR